MFVPYEFTDINLSLSVGSALGFGGGGSPQKMSSANRTPLGALAGQAESADRTIEDQLREAPVAIPSESQVLRKEGYEEFVIPPLEVLLTWDIVTQVEPGDAIEEVLALIPKEIPSKRRKQQQKAADRRRSRDVRSSVEEEPLRCAKCEELFEGEKELLQHTAEAHPFECPDCSRDPIQ